MLPKCVETVSALAPGPEHSDEHKEQPNGISNPAHIASLRVGGDQSRVAGATPPPHKRTMLPRDNAVGAYRTSLPGP
jgi:hypothetical protein